MDCCCIEGETNPSVDVVAVDFAAMWVEVDVGCAVADTWEVLVDNEYRMYVVAVATDAVVSHLSDILGLFVCTVIHVVGNVTAKVVDGNWMFDSHCFDETACIRQPCVSFAVAHSRSTEKNVAHTCALDPSGRYCPSSRTYV